MKMKTLPILCLLLAGLATAIAQTNTYTFAWSANPASDLVTNYVLRCTHPIDDTAVASNYGVSTNATVLLSPGIWECVVLAQNSVGISDPSDMVIVGQDSPIPPGEVSGITVRHQWFAGAFDLTATWTAATNAASYTASLLNLVTGTALTRTGANRSASWLRVPASAYRITVIGIATNGVQGPVATLELGVLKPGKVRDFK